MKIKEWQETLAYLTRPGGPKQELKV